MAPAADTFAPAMAPAPDTFAPASATYAPPAAYHYNATAPDGYMPSAPNMAPAAALLARLGPEPFDPALDDARFHALLKQRRAPIKAVLLSGQAVVGAGNIYACEALFRAGIDPRTAAHLLSRPRAARLLQAVRETLQEALQLGGSTLRDFRDAHGMGGAFQDQAAVYGREGQPCTRCAAPVRRIVQAQRATYYCRACQRRWAPPRLRPCRRWPSA
jgi:formamidopyrimidine-DNA glycosylase